jgi:molybdenum-dependent DNA-binding transcriptional regulator ModE
MAAAFVFIVAQFLAFARAGSMQAAAKALRVHQSTIQRRIAELEESLGRRLVEPHGGGYRLTEELQSTPGCRRGLSLLPLRAPLVL